MSLILSCIQACQIQFTKGLLLSLHVSISSTAFCCRAGGQLYDAVVHSDAFMSVDSKGQLYKELAQGCKWWPLILQTSSQCLGWFLPSLVPRPLLPWDMNCFRACLHWHISHCLNTSLLRSSLCWASHWANCWFAQASYHLEICFSSASSYFSPTPCKLFWILELSLEQLWAIGFFKLISIKFWLSHKARGGLVLVLSSRFCKIPLL